uniref:MULE transposase domain-containing protein n=1 Tax=Daphnia galeata TaxID=27404 RepID=A0A8J2WMY0_9CRUS|nr:unnamed protein product [Daphnia galeata]
MADEALDFAKNTLFAGAQPTIVRKILQDKFFTNLIRKSQNEWKDTVDYLQKLQENPNNVIKNIDVSFTKVTIPDKNCAEIAALAKYFPKVTAILGQFHVLKAFMRFRKINLLKLNRNCSSKASTLRRTLMETGSRFPISGAILDVAIYQLLATTQPPGTLPTYTRTWMFYKRTGGYQRSSAD